jgi:hypothetical protein
MEANILEVSTLIILQGNARSPIQAYLTYNTQQINYEINLTSVQRYSTLAWLKYAVAGHSCEMC